MANKSYILQLIDLVTITAQKLKFSNKDVFSKCDQIRSFLRIWSHLLQKSLMENFILLCSEYSNWLICSTAWRLNENKWKFTEQATFQNMLEKANLERFS